MRLDQFVSQALNISRSDAKRLIKNAAIHIEQQPCRQPATQLNDHQAVYYEGQRLEKPGEQYFILHKPLNMVCSHIDDGYPSALRLLPVTYKKLHFAGRLDANTTGLVLVSSDGQWCHRVSSPNSNKQKHYRVTLAEKITTDAVLQLQNGILLHGEEQTTAACNVRLLSDCCCEITLTEGKYHQVRRMFAAVGNHVTALHRFAIGALNLDDEPLPEGSYRSLTPDETALF